MSYRARQDEIKWVFVVVKYSFFNVSENEFLSFKFTNTIKPKYHDYFACLFLTDENY